MQYLKNLNNSLTQTQKTELLTEYLKLNDGELNNLKNYLISIDCIKWFNNAKMGFSAFAILCMVAIKNKKSLN